MRRMMHVGRMYDGLWLATSMSASNVAESISYRANSPPLHLKLVVVSEAVMGAPSPSVIRYYDEEEVTLLREVKSS